MISTSRLGRPPAIRTGAPVLSDGRWWKAPKHVLDGVAPFAVLSPASGRFMLNGRAVNDNALISRQGGIKYVVGADGVLSAVPANTLAYDWSSGIRELLFEGQATNYAKQSGSSGAAPGVVGAGGSVPTEWSILSGYSGLTIEVTGTGTRAGIPWVEFRIHGTNNGGSTAYPGPTIETRPTASVGQTWTYSLWAELVSGAWPPNKGRVGIAEELSDGGYLTGGEATLQIAGWARYSFTRTLTNASTGQVRPYVTLGISAGSTVDVTFRLGGLQFEQGSVATSYIPTSGSVVTRLADVAPLWAGAGGATTWAWRGNVPALIAGQLLLGGSNTGASDLIVRAKGANPAQLTLIAGNSIGLDSSVNAIPGIIGVCGGWGASGRMFGVLGTTVSDALPGVAVGGINIGGRSGGMPGQVLRLRELVAWQLPDRPSAAGCQAQARLWSA